MHGPCDCGGGAWTSSAETQAPPAWFPFSSRRLWHERPAGIAAGAGLTAIDVTAIPPVVRGGQEWKCLGDAVRRDVHAHGARRAREEIDTVAGPGVDVVHASHDPDRDVVTSSWGGVRSASPPCPRVALSGADNRHARRSRRSARLGTDPACAVDHVAELLLVVVDWSRSRRPGRRSSRCSPTTRGGAPTSAAETRIEAVFARAAGRIAWAAHRSPAAARISSSSTAAHGRNGTAVSS